MNYIEEYYDILNNSLFHTKVLQELICLKDPYQVYLDKKNDVIHYLIFGKKTLFIQLIFQKRKDKKNRNFDILEYGLQRKKIAKNYLAMIDNIIQYNLILYPNPATFSQKEWIFKDDNNFFPKNIYKIYLLNLYYIQKQNAEFQNLKKLFEPFL